MRDGGEKPFSMEEREEREEEEEEEEEREERNRFIPSFFLPLLFLAVLVSLFLSDATTTTTPSRNFLSATGHVNYVGRRDENLGHRSNNDERTRQFDENENRDSSFYDLFGGSYFFGGKPT